MKLHSVTITNFKRFTSLTVTGSPKQRVWSYSLARMAAGSPRFLTL